MNKLVVDLTFGCRFDIFWHLVADPESSRQTLVNHQNLDTPPKINMEPGNGGFQ